MPAQWARGDWFHGPEAGTHAGSIQSEAGIFNGGQEIHRVAAWTRRSPSHENECLEVAEASTLPAGDLVDSVNASLCVRVAAFALKSGPALAGTA